MLSRIEHTLEKFYAFLDQPISLRPRFILVVLCVPLLLSLTAPLWRISMEAPQYQSGLSLDIYAHKIEGGDDGRDLREINLLNH